FLKFFIRIICINVNFQPVWLSKHCFCFIVCHCYTISLLVFLFFCLFHVFAAYFVSRKSITSLHNASVSLNGSVSICKLSLKPSRKDGTRSSYSSASFICS